MASFLRMADVLQWSAWPKPVPSPRAVLIFSAVRLWSEWTCSLLLQQASPSSSSSAMTDRKAVIKNADMSEDMQQDAVDCATQAMEKYNIEKDIAAYIKKVRQDGCMDGSKQSPRELLSVAANSQLFFYPQIYFWSMWRWGSCDQGRRWGFFFTGGSRVPPFWLIVFTNTLTTHRKVVISISIPKFFMFYTLILHFKDPMQSVRLF